MIGALSCGQCFLAYWFQLSDCVCQVKIPAGGGKNVVGNKSGYATVSVSEDGAQTTCPGEVLRVCGSLSRALVRVGKGAWCTHTSHARDSSNASCRTWRRPIIWRAGSRGMTRTPKMSCRKPSYGHTNFLAIFMG